MVKKSMVIELIEDGAKLLRELDRNGYPVEAMFWVDEPDDDRSRLMIASPDVIVHSSAPGYELIQELLPALDLSGLELSDIYLIEPDSRRFQTLLAFAKNSNRINSGPSWIRKADAVVYRWSSDSLRGHMDPAMTARDIEQVWKDAPSSMFGKPTLLVTANGGNFTLRVHPKHKLGLDLDRRRVRRDFETAIRNSRPDCRITWLSEDSDDVAA
jgi:hypothetical protein